ncbi:MAG: hypothetical protein US62_C0043G0006 [Candidatus Woesebacteria bacterium GW2011_GWA1_37_8]|uniref:Uncharacterized protein n=2 Tax=Candidatus Woeseibacteriota TaxID=1752722 RepID=A0A0G0L3C2_9BACT|nr:MAG: coiled-coil [Microgenomates group bacterium GW2011_GWC1_37_12b]KKQ43723.1 MAG: hypothetical protein US62_C0043G0006 [Candidatus Woesebacteria bacterium GW2011_GWA1_37_8]KKQ86478.1 MAG: hypothetical protein UT10_C0024G0013 [Candidatus Woesebacteria bacterium GW2011_GWB1_38_8b]
MKNILIFVVGLFLLLSSFVVVKAKSNANSGSNKSAVGETRSTNAKKNEDTANTLSPSELAKTKSATAKLNKIKEVTDDPVIIEEVDNLAQEQEQIEASAEAVLNKADRPAAVKFLIGPDYKNLGQLRSEVVHTRNNIRQLERIQEKAGEDEQLAIQAALSELEESASRLQSEMYTKLSGFSLFGWLFRWLNGFTPPDEEVLPTVTVTPTITGELTVTPISTQEATMTPTQTLVPTETLTVTPTP